MYSCDRANGTRENGIRANGNRVNVGIVGNTFMYLVYVNKMFKE